MLRATVGGAPLNRREMLGRMCAGFGLAAAAQMLGQDALASGVGKSGLHHPAKAKRVIFLFLNGGPSHLDTFDPKPELKRVEGQQPEGELYKKSKGAGYLPSPLSFRKYGQSGIEVSESLPHLAGVIDDCCVIRSMKTDVPNHEPALLQMHTGNLQPIRPSLGSWLLYGLGTENQNLPGYVVLRPSPKIVVGPALWSNSFLPAEFQAASVITKDMAVDKLIANIRNQNLDDTAQREQIDLVQALNRKHAAARQNDSELNGQIKAMETAFQMQKRAMATFDISREPKHVRDAYGDSVFARSCLLARRLVEDGVRFVTVYYTDDKNNQPWDTHSSHDSGHKKLCADADQPSAALIADLKQRGLLDDTLVIWGGEFGRTIYSQGKLTATNYGRDHHPRNFGVWLAGGGIKGGLAIGRTDDYCYNIEEDPVHVHDLRATILHTLGIDHTRLTYKFQGRWFRLTDVHGEVVKKVLV